MKIFFEVFGSSWNGWFFDSGIFQTMGTGDSSKIQRTAQDWFWTFHRTALRKAL
jgi:hypothetical protein